MKQNHSWRLELESLFNGLAKPQKLAVFAGLNLAMLASVESKAATLSDVTAGFYHAANCLYVKRSMKNKDANELMSRGVQLADLFDALSQRRAEAELKRELHAMRAICYKMLAIDDRQAA
ncbi:MAG TPA: hypothetical protein VFI31_28995 [Pirellulales bacterium]|nr:hypothetical protein [Pirellulales bacterium]